MSRKSSALDKLPPSVIVGVTGHRNIRPDDPAITAIVRAQLERIATRARGSRILLLSGLAEGADRLVVQAAVAALNAPYLAVLALPQEHFVKDFADQASRDSFERLLAGAADVVEAPAMAPERQIADYGEPRNHQYAWVGAYLARHAHVLIALWDGAPARGTGGTAEVVSWFIKNKVPDRYAISFAPAAKRVPGVRRELVHINPASRSVEVRAV